MGSDCHYHEPANGHRLPHDAFMSIIGWKDSLRNIEPPILRAGGPGGYAQITAAAMFDMRRPR